MFWTLGFHQHFSRSPSSDGLIKYVAHRKTFSSPFFELPTSPLRSFSDGRPESVLSRQPPRNRARYFVLLGRENGILRPEITWPASL